MVIITMGMIWDIACGFGLLFIIVSALIFFTAVILGIYICIISIFSAPKSESTGYVDPKYRMTDEERAVSYFTRNSNFYIKEEDGKWKSFVLGRTIIKETKKEILDEIVTLYLSRTSDLENHKKYEVDVEYKIVENPAFEKEKEKYKFKKITHFRKNITNFGILKFKKITSF